MKVISRTLPLGLVLGAFALLFFTAGKAAPEDRSESALAANRRGVDLFRGGRFQEARRAFEAALAAEDSYDEARRNLAHSLAALGQKELQSGNLEGARELLEEAVDHWPGEPEFHLLLAVVNFRGGDLYSARLSADEALEGDEENALAREVLGDIDYQDGYLNRAVAEWERALEGKNAAAGRLRGKIEKVRREMEAESGFERDVSVHFSLQHDGPLQRTVSRAILEELEELYELIGGELGSYPRGDIPVIIYSRMLFSEITRSPLWVAGTFDGKIRIPAGGISTAAEVAMLRPILAHELAHAFIRSIASRGLPLWFEEGLAKHFEGIPTERAFAYAEEHRLALPTTFDDVDRGLRGRGFPVNASYLAALLAVRTLIEGEGFWTVRRIVEAVGRGTPFEEALLDEARLEGEELEEKWRYSLP